MGRHLGIPPRGFESYFMAVIPGVVPGVVWGLHSDYGTLAHLVIPVESFQVHLKGCHPKEAHGARKRVTTGEDGAPCGS